MAPFRIRPPCRGFWPGSRPSAYRAAKFADCTTGIPPKASSGGITRRVDGGLLGGGRLLGARPGRYASGRCRAGIGAERKCVDVPQRRYLLGGEGPLATDISGKGQPPGEQSPEAVAVAGEEGDVDKQPDPPAQEATDLQRPG